MNGLQNNNSTKSNSSDGKSIKAIALHLSRSKSTGKEVENTVFIREQEERFLIDFLDKDAFFTEILELNNYIAEGAEQKVYFDENKNSVLKVNSRVFYASWEDYFYSLLLHNFFFPDTSYHFLGMKIENQKLLAVVEQPFISANQTTNLENVKSFLQTLNFINNKNNDYKNQELGIILEDLHDENVLTNNGILYFIDTVFYITPEFYKNPFLSIDDL